MSVLNILTNRFRIHLFAEAAAAVAGSGLDRGGFVMPRAFIIYGTASGIARRVVVTDEVDFDINNHITAGESYADWDLVEGQFGFGIKSLLQRKKGIT